MAIFNSQLNNLFNNYLNQQQYKKKKFDANGDGRKNAIDKQYLSNEEKNLLKQTELFDVNGDGKFDQKDIDMFVKGDVNGDGKITQDEINFIAKYKSDLIKSFITQKADFIIDEKMYQDGKIQYSIVNNNKSSLPAPDGNKIKFTDKVSVEVQQGEKVVINSDGTVSITSQDGKTVKRYFKGGTMQYSITNNATGAFPCRVNNTIKFKENLTVKVENGEIAVINSDGTVNITSKDRKTTKTYNADGSPANTTVIGPTVKAYSCDINEITQYDASGNVISSSIRVWRDVTQMEYQINSIPAGLDVSKITKVSSNADGTFTIIADGKTYTFERTSAKKGHVEYNNAASSSQVIRASGCDVNEIIRYDENGNVVSSYIRAWNEAAQTEYQISPVPEGLDVSKITNVFSNKDGTFTVIAGGKTYKNFEQILVNNYNKTTGELTASTTRNAEGKTVSRTVYSNGYSTTHTGYAYDGKGNLTWTHAERLYDDGCRIEYSRKFNPDGSYERTEYRYNENNVRVEERIEQYDSSGNEIYVKEYVSGYYDTTLQRYVGGQLNIRTAKYDADGNKIATTREGISNTTGKRIEYKTYDFNDDGTASVVLKKYDANGNISEVTTSTCYFVPNYKNCEYRYYVRSDNCIEIWHYNNQGVRTEVSVTHPTGENADARGNNQVVHIYNAAGQWIRDEWHKVKQEDIISQYGV